MTEQDAREALRERLAEALVAADSREFVTLDAALDEGRILAALLPAVEEYAAEVWDEGYRRACGDHHCGRASRDHGQRHVNPYHEES